MFFISGHHGSVLILSAVVCVIIFHKVYIYDIQVVLLLPAYAACMHVWVIVSDDELERYSCIVNMLFTCHWHVNGPVCNIHVVRIGRPLCRWCVTLDDSRSTRDIVSAVYKHLPCAFGAPDMSEETFTLHDCGRGIPYPLLGTMPIVGWHQGHISLSASSSTDWAVSMASILC